MSASIWSPGGSQQVPALPAVSPVTFVQGTATNPGINFVGDTDTGIWSESVGYLNFAVNGVNQVTIDPTGAMLVNNIVTGVEVDIASSTTTDIGSVASNSVRVTGTATIASFGTTYRGPKFVRFASSLTLTDSPALILPGATNISITAGDTCIVTPKATLGIADGWVVVALQKGVGSGGSGATGATGNYVFYENDQTITGNYTLSNGKNAMTAGPITINTGITVTIPTGATWSIV